MSVILFIYFFWGGGGEVARKVRSRSVRVPFYPSWGKVLKVFYSEIFRKSPKGWGFMMFNL